MNDDRHDIVGMIQEVVRKQTIFYKHYVGQVIDNQDEVNKGRIQVLIPELGLLTNDQGLWAYPRDKQSMIIPAIGTYVEVYFINANPNRAVYLGMSIEMENMGVVNYDGDPNNSVLFEAQTNNGNYIKYNDTDKQLDIMMEKLIINQGTEPFVLGTQLKTYLTDLVNNIFNLHTHNVVDPVSGTLVSAVPNQLGQVPADTILSTQIKGK
jgi:hypothetical protein